jgi:hypothetical protein
VGETIAQLGKCYPHCFYPPRPVFQSNPTNFCENPDFPVSPQLFNWEFIDTGLTVTLSDLLPSTDTDQFNFFRTLFQLLVRTIAFSELAFYLSENNLDDQLFNVIAGFDMFPIGVILLMSDKRLLYTSTVGRRSSSYLNDQELISIVAQATQINEIPRGINLIGFRHLLLFKTRNFSDMISNYFSIDSVQTPASPSSQSPGIDRFSDNQQFLENEILEDPEALSRFWTTASITQVSQPFFLGSLYHSLASLSDIDAF